MTRARAQWLNDNRCSCPNGDMSRDCEWCHAFSAFAFDAIAAALAEPASPVKAHEHSTGGKWFAAGEDWRGVPAEPRREDCYDSPEAAITAWRDHIALLATIEWLRAEPRR